MPIVKRIIFGYDGCYTHGISPFEVAIVFGVVWKKYKKHRHFPVNVRDFVQKMKLQILYANFSYFIIIACCSKKYLAFSNSSMSHNNNYYIT